MTENEHWKPRPEVQSWCQQKVTEWGEIRKEKKEQAGWTTSENGHEEFP